MLVVVVVVTVMVVVKAVVVLVKEKVKEKTGQIMKRKHYIRYLLKRMDLNISI